VLVAIKNDINAIELADYSLWADPEFVLERIRFRRNSQR